MTVEPTDPFRPIACSSLTFCDRPLPDALRGVRELGFTSVDLAVFEGWAHVQPSSLTADYDAVARTVRTEIARNALSVPALNCSMGHDDVERRARATLRLAEEVEARTVTFGAPHLGATRHEALAWAAPIVTAAADSAIATSVEFHSNTFTEAAADVVALVEATGLSITFDTSHYWVGPSQGRGLERLAPHVSHLHVRDAGTSLAEYQLPWGTGAVDLPLVVSALASAGYRGAASIEYIADPAFSGDLAESVLAAERALRAATHHRG